jgi:hypothetical protein
MFTVNFFPNPAEYFLRSVIANTLTASLYIFTTIYISLKYNEYLNHFVLRILHLIQV